MIESRYVKNDSFSTVLSAGTYFIGVSGSAYDSTQYALTLTQTPDLSGDNLLTGTSTKDNLSGLGGNDTISGLGEDDLILGNEGDDRLAGDTGNDILVGGLGNDTLIGGTGNDRLDGEAGNDVVTTGSGRDRIVIRRGEGFDRITDFKNNQDKIDLVGIKFGKLTLKQQQNDVVVKLEGSNLLRIEDSSLRVISRADFV